MAFLHRVFGLLEKIKPVKVAYAHCDVPCGIYDPHLAQLAANTVIRMVNLIGELPQIVPTMTPEQRLEALNKLNRYIATKEEHAEVAKRELRILWGDYFKPEHLQKFPEIHDLVWKGMKLASKARQEINLQASEELLETINKIAEIFWKTKDVKTARVKAPYPTGKEVAWPKV